MSLSEKFKFKSRSPKKSGTNKLVNARTVFGRHLEAQRVIAADMIANPKRVPPKDEKRYFQEEDDGSYSIDLRYGRRPLKFQSGELITVDDLQAVHDAYQDLIDMTKAHDSEIDAALLEALKPKEKASEPSTASPPGDTNKGASAGQKAKG